MYIDQGNPWYCRLEIKNWELAQVELQTAKTLGHRLAILYQIEENP